VYSLLIFKLPNLHSMHTSIGLGYLLTRAKETETATDVLATSCAKQLNRL